MYKTTRIKSWESNGDHQEARTLRPISRNRSNPPSHQSRFQPENLSPIFLSMRCISDITSPCSSGSRLTDVVYTMNYVKVVYSSLPFFLTHTHTHNTSNGKKLYDRIISGSATRCTFAKQSCIILNG